MKEKKNSWKVESKEPSVKIAAGGQSICTLWTISLLFLDAKHWLNHHHRNRHENYKQTKKWWVKVWKKSSFFFQLSFQCYFSAFVNICKQNVESSCRHLIVKVFMKAFALSSHSRTSNVHFIRTARPNLLLTNKQNKLSTRVVIKRKQEKKKEMKNIPNLTKL